MILILDETLFMQATYFMQKTRRLSLQVLRAGTRLTAHRALAGSPTLQKNQET